MPDAIPLWFFILALGIVLVIAIAAHGYIIWRFRSLDEECRVLSVAIGQYKGKVEENTFTMKALNRTLERLFGASANGG